MKRGKSSKRTGRLLFFIPVVAVLGLVVFGLISVISSQSGVLIIQAMSSGRYSPQVSLRVSFTVGTNTGVTPVNLTLPQGGYTVAYGQKNWYASPPSRSLVLVGGKTEYAVAIYSPLIKLISVTESGFNTTSITALHGVTPVIWINEGGSAVTLSIGTVGHILIDPSQNYTHVFASQGSFDFALSNTNFNGTVNSV